MSKTISVETRMTYEDMKKYMWFHLFRKGKRLKPLIIVMLAAVGVALLSTLALAVLEGLSIFSVQTWLTVALLPVILLLFLCIVPINARLAYKTSKVHFESTQRFTFGPDDVQIETFGQNVTGSSAYRYEAFHKVCEVKDAFYLYVNNNQAHLVSKRNMSAADEDDLARLLEEKLGKKFVRCY
jgi:hypothetical protein